MARLWRCRGLCGILTGSGLIPSQIARCDSEPTGVAGSSKQRKRVCCIGAGAAGLACAKELLDRKHDVTVLESRKGIGGVWQLDPSGGSVGVRLEQRATSSKYYLGFSDYPIPPESPDFVGHEEYLAYLNRYADHFGVTSCVRLGTQVQEVRQVQDGWEVTMRSSTGCLDTSIFDAVAVCSGLHREANTLPSLGQFQGRVVHAKAIKDPTELRGKRVVVVGGGESGAEFAHLAATLGIAPAVLSLRRGVTVIPPYLPLPLSGRMPDARYPPVDLNERRVVAVMPPRLKHIMLTQGGIFEPREENPTKHTPGRTGLAVANAAAGVVQAIVAPFFAVGALCANATGWLQPQTWANAPFSKDPVALCAAMNDTVAKISPDPPARMLRDTKQLEAYTARAAAFRMRGFTERHYKEVRSLLEEYSGTFHSGNFFTKSDDFVYDLMEGKLMLRPGIDRYEGREVLFQDGSHVEADVVVWCTGYEPQVPFLRLPQTSGDGAGSSVKLDGTMLYKHVFHPDCGQSLAFIGFARPQLGAMPPIAELQARWFGAVLDGEAPLPPKEDMQTAVGEARDAYGERVYADRLRSQVDFARYTADLAGMIGCHPEVGIRTFFEDHGLWRAFWLGPVLPQAFRIADSDKVKAAAAREYLEQVYVTFMTRQ